MTSPLAGHRAFTYQELHQASAGFSTDNIVGEGGFGNVYRGQLPDDTPIAIKRLDRCGLQVSGITGVSCSIKRLQDTCVIWHIQLPKL